MLEEIDTGKMEVNLNIVDTVKIKNITLNDFTILHTDNCSLTLELENKNYRIKCDRGCFVFLEKGVSFSCEFVKIHENMPPFRVIGFNRNAQILLKDILKTVYPFQFNDNDISRDKIIIERSSGYQYSLFVHLLNTKDVRLRILETAHFIATMDNNAKIINSIYASSGVTFADKVKAELESDLSKNWRISMIANKYHISEVSVRKRLDSEKTSFSRLLLRARMDKAMQLILDNELQINSISEKVGISSQPYFIKTFKEFFGITPKQFSIHFRR